MASSSDVSSRGRSSSGRATATLSPCSRAVAGARTRTCSGCHNVRRRIRSGSRASGPRVARWTCSGGRTARTGARVYRRVSGAPPTRGYRASRPAGWSAGSARAGAGGLGDPLLDSADRPCRRWPPSSGSSNASSSARRLGCSGRACSPSSSSDGSSGRWRPSASRRPTARSCPNRFVVHLHPDDLAGFGDMTSTPGLRAGRRGAGRSRGPTATRSSTGRGSTSSPTRASSGRTSASTPASPTRSARRRDRRRRTGRGHADAGTTCGRGRPTRPHTLVFTVPRPTPRRPRLHVSPTRRRGAATSSSTGGPDDRPGHRQRPRPRRRARLAPPRPDHRPARDARLHRPRAAPTARGSTACGSPRWSWGPATGSSWATRVSWSRSPGRRPDGRLPPRPVGRPDPLPRPPLPVPVPGRPGPAARPAGGGPRAGRPRSAGSSSSPRPAGEPRAGPLVRPRRDHDARSRRQQRDRHRRPVRLGRARGPDVPRPELVRRGPRQHERHLRQRPADRRASRRSASATSSRSARSGCGSSGPATA